MRILKTLAIMLCAYLATPLFADFEVIMETPEGQPYSNELAYEVLNHYAKLNCELYRDALDAVIEFNMEVYKFRDDPTEAQLEKLKRMWVDARKIYGKTEIFRFSEGPVDTLGLEPLMNAWPIDESLIDYTVADENSGIVNNPDKFPKITPQLLESMNEQGGEANVTTGWHAIEFLLWGQDLDADGPGTRPITDFTEAKNADRRIEYLIASTDLLRHHLGILFEEWNPANYDNAAGEFYLRAPPKLLNNIVKGMSTMAGKELASERLSVALRNKSQEDEHSCFSDTTYNDFQANFEGFEIIFYGDYVTEKGEVIEGPGIYDLILAVNPDTAENLSGLVINAREKIKDIPHPFDQAIIAPEDDERHQRLKAAITALWPIVYAMTDASDELKLGQTR